MNNKDINKIINNLLNALKKPFPKDKEAIILRSIWLSISCVIRCKKILNTFFFEVSHRILFNKKLITFICPFCEKEYKNKEEFMKHVNSFLHLKDKMEICFEMSILCISVASKFLEDVLNKEFENIKNVEDIFSDCEIQMINTLTMFFRDKEPEAIFDIYASYTYFKKGILTKKENHSSIEWLEKSLRNFANIEMNVYDEENHFASRVNKKYKNINKKKLVEFAKLNISIQGLLLTMDAFTGVEQSEIIRVVKHFFSIDEKEQE